DRVSERTGVRLAAVSLCGGRAVGALFRRLLPQPQLPERTVNPLLGQLLLHAILAEARAQAAEVDAVELLVLVEAGEHDALETGGGIAVDLQALRANLLHHALHRRVDRGDRLVAGLEMAGQDALSGAGDGRHHAVGSDGDHAVDLAERNRHHTERARAIGV